MQAFVPYLFFNGNCREAMNFYKDCFGGKLEIMTYADGPQEGGAESISDKSKVMHACLSSDRFSLMASDDPFKKTEFGNSVQITVQCETPEEVDKLFGLLCKDGHTIMPLEKTFWASNFGVLSDRFGICWMLNCPLN